ncbi:MAG: hypothetical protein HQM08_20625 [Candidatus Riflebacteria bacterium]|nr:hypothetical protein [Candidatus Riflebacteria bacterium]
MKRFLVILFVCLCSFFSVSTIANAQGTNPYDDRATVDPYAPTVPHPGASTDPYATNSRPPVQQTDPYSTSQPNDDYRLAPLAASSDWRVRLDVAKNPRVSAELLVRLSNDSDQDVKAAAANNPKLTSPFTNCNELDILANSANWKVRQAVARHPNTPANTLLRLSNDSDQDVKAAVANNPKLTSPQTNPGELEMFATSSDWKIRQAVARHVNTSAETLLRLSNDSDQDVKAAVAGNPKLTSQYTNCNDLDILAGSSNWKVRQTVAMNRSTSRNTLMRLVNDSDSDVRRAANDSLNYR